MRLKDLFPLAWYTVKSDIADVPLHLFGRRVRAETAAAAGDAYGDAPEVLLDVCTGTGSVLFEYARRFPGVEIIVFDRDRGLLELVRRRLGKAGCDNVRTIESDAREMPLAASSVDVVNISFGLHESTRLDRGLILGECFRVLRPGGLLVVSDYREADSRAGSVLLRLYMLAAEPRWVPEIFAGGLEREIEAAGFEIERTRTDLPLTRLVIARRGQV